MLSMTKEEFESLQRKRNPHQKPIAQLSQAPPETVNPIKSPKYRNIHVYIFEDGFTSFNKDEARHGKVILSFDSKKEYARWLELQILEKAGTIQNLDLQASLEIQPKTVTQSGEKLSAIIYKADFRYTQDGKTVIEDVKGIDQRTGKVKSTEAFKLKWKLLKAKYPEYVFNIV